MEDNNATAFVVTDDAGDVVAGPFTTGSAAHHAADRYEDATGIASLVVEVTL